MVITTINKQAHKHELKGIKIRVATISLWPSVTSPLLLEAQFQVLIS